MKKIFLLTMLITIVSLNLYSAGEGSGSVSFVPINVSYPQSNITWTVSFTAGGTEFNYGYIYVSRPANWGDWNIAPNNITFSATNGYGITLTVKSNHLAFYVRQLYANTGKIYVYFNNISTTSGTMEGDNFFRFYTDPDGGGNQKAISSQPYIKVLPSNFTPTITNTKTNTPTRTNTYTITTTFTHTNTATITNTPTITNTFTSTLTFTMTGTPIATQYIVQFDVNGNPFSFPVKIDGIGNTNEGFSRLNPNFGLPVYISPNASVYIMDISGNKIGSSSYPGGGFDLNVRVKNNSTTDEPVLTQSISEAKLYACKNFLYSAYDNDLDTTEIKPILVSVPAGVSINTKIRISASDAVVVNFYRGCASTSYGTPLTATALNLYTTCSSTPSVSVFENGNTTNAGTILFTQLLPTAGYYTVTGNSDSLFMRLISGLYFIRITSLSDNTKVGVAIENSEY